MSDAEHYPLDRAKLRIGTTLKGKYRLDRILGIGGMAAVYGGRHRNGNPVAVKVLFPELSVDPGMRARFHREGYVANAVEHRGAVRVLDDDVAEDGSVFLVMELLEGQSLDARWERCQRRMSPREVMVHLHQVLDVLAAAHAKGITHRDVKPENLFLTKDGTTKILDFGIARLRESAGASATRSGTLFGTPAFMSPEQALGRVKEVDARSDVYAVGATAFTLLSGRYVHPAGTAEEMMVCAATQPAPSLRSVAPEAPEALVEIVDRALAFARGARWESARAMQEAIGRAYADVVGEPIPSAWLQDPTVDPPREAPLASLGHATGAMGDASELPTVRLGDAVVAEDKTIPRAGQPRSTIAGMSASMARVLPSTLRRVAAAHPGVALAVAAAAFLTVLLVGVAIAVGISRSSAFSATSGSASAVPSSSSPSPSAAPSVEPPSSATAAAPSVSSVPIDALPKVPTVVTPVSKPPKPAPPKPPKRDPLAP